MCVRVTRNLDSAFCLLTFDLMVLAFGVPDTIGKSVVCVVVSVYVAGCMVEDYRKCKANKFVDSFNALMRSLTSPATTIATIIIDAVAI